MRGVLIRVLLVVGLAGSVTPAAAEDWSLTREPKVGARVRKRSAPAGTRSLARPVPSLVAGPRSEARYLGVLEADPGHTTALRRLLASARQQDGNLDALQARVQTRLRVASGSFGLTMLVGHIERARGRSQEAWAAYNAAADLQPKSASPAIAQAELAAEVGDHAARVRWLERALSQANAGRRFELLRLLGEAALDQGDFEVARGHFRTLARFKKGSVFARTEFARALAARGQHARAADAFAEVARGLSGDPRVLPPILLGEARAAIEAGRPADAIPPLTRARKLARSSPGLLHEAQELLVRAHRATGTLAVFADELASAGVRDFETLRLLARLRDELGDGEAALRALRRAQTKRPSDRQTHRQLVRILERQGDVVALIAEHRRLLRLRPTDASLATALADLLRDDGSRVDGLRVLERAGRASRDADSVRLLHDAYLRWGERTRAHDMLQRWTRVAPRDPAPWTMLGESHMQRGDEQAALRAWRRIVRIGSDRAASHAHLGAVLLDHGLGVEAARHYERAVKLAPNDLAYQRGWAETLERSYRGHDAVPVWQRILELAGDDRSLRRDARRHIVDIWASRGELAQHMGRYQALFGGDIAATDEAAYAAMLDAGRFVVEGHLRLARGRRRALAETRHLEQAERGLERILAQVPNDVEALLALERLRRARGDSTATLATLRQLRKADPSNAKVYLDRMAKLALTVYRDGDALAYARELAAMSPEDPATHRRLGDLYRARQNADEAIVAYRRAVELDPHGYVTHVDLAQLYVASGKNAQAAMLLYRVVTGSRDDALVARAARAAMQGQVAHGRLEELLFPLALSQPTRPVFRRLLVELYEKQTHNLLGLVAAQGPAAVRARAAIGEMGKRAIKPLLEALRDPDRNQRARAVAILAELEHPAAAAPLLRVAEGPGDAELRRRALLAAGRHARPAMVARLAALAEGPERRLRPVAAWALAGMASETAVPHMVRLAQASSPAVRGYALLGLAAGGAAVGEPMARRALAVDVAPWVRACAALAVARHAADSAGPALTAAFERRVGLEAAVILASLVQLTDEHARPAVARALFSSDVRLRRAARRAAGGRRPSRERWLRALPAPHERPRLRSLLAEFAAPGTGELGGWIERLGSAFVAAAEDALTGPREQVAIGLDVIEHELSELAGRDAADGRATMGVRGQLVRLGEVVSHLRAHPVASVRAHAWSLSFRLPVAGSDPSYPEALGDPAVAVRRAVLEGLLTVDQPPASAVTPQAIALARADASWVLRRLSVRLLGRLGTAAAAEALRGALRADPYALVRVAAAEQLQRDPHARAVLEHAVRADPDPQVRLVSARALRSLGKVPRRSQEEPGLPPPRPRIPVDNRSRN